MYLLINSFFPFVCWKQSLSREPHLLAGISVSLKRGYYVFSSNDTQVFQGRGKRYPSFQGEPTFSPPIRVAFTNFVGAARTRSIYVVQDSINHTYNKIVLWLNTTINLTYNVIVPI